MVVILHVNIIVWYIDIIVYYYYIDITKLVSLTLQYIDIYWLVVWNMHFIFHNIWGNPSHWLSYFSIWLKPQARYIYMFYLYIYLCIHHQYIYILEKNVPRKTGIYPLILQRPFFSGQACDADPTVLGGHPTCRGEPKAAKVSDFYAVHRCF